MSWMYTVLSACFLLLVFMVWKEVTRENKARLFWRLVASAGLVTGVACIALPLSIRKPVTSDPDTQAVLLTNGYNTDSVKNFLRKFQQQPVVFAFTQDDQLPAVTGAVYMYDQDSLRQLLAKYASVHVFGNGLGKQVTDSLRDASFVFHPSVLPAGIQSINWTRKLRQGEDLLVQGSFYNPGSSPVKLLFSGLQAHLDSTIISPASTTDFNVSAVPKFGGKALYEITALTGKDTLEHELLPVLVDTLSAIKVLVLSSSPDFENKFLKDWLAKHGYEVDVRTVITINKYNRLSVNAVGKTSEQINQGLLQHIDVLISDPASLQELSSAELNTVTAQVRNGLGLIIRADSLLPRSFYTSYFPLSQSTDSLQQQLILYTNDASPDTAKLLAEQPLYIRASYATQPLVSGNQGGIFVSSALAGTGKIVLSTINNSYSWLLAGNEKMYESFWSLMIRKAVRKRADSESWTYSPALPITNEPVSVSLETDRNGAPQNNISNITLPFKQDMLLPFRWQGEYWPLPGWQTSGSSTSYLWFVYDKNSWKSMRASQLLRDTKKYLAVHKAGQKQPWTDRGTTTVPVPLIYFFIVFVLSAAYLWIEKKLM